MRILLVEDEEKVSRFVTLGLNAEQFVVDCAKDGITGYEMSTERPYDVLIIDLMLPRLSGSELISRLRQNRVETPILVLTARDQLDDKIKNFENGADDYLTKPFSIEVLLARLRAVSRRGAIPRPVRLQIGEDAEKILPHEMRQHEPIVQRCAPARQRPVQRITP